MKKIKTKHIIYPMVLIFAVLVPLMKYYSSTPKMNACVLDYVDSMEKSNYKGVLYNIKGQNHIEPINSNMTHALEQYRTGRAVGCLMVSNNLFTDINNTMYCSVTYMIRKAPIDPNLKKPLSIIKK